MSAGRDTPSALVCGEGHGAPGGPPFGCGDALPLEDAYRCLDCKIRFHEGCLRAHFKSSCSGVGTCSEAEKYRKALLDIMTVADKAFS